MLSSVVWYHVSFHQLFQLGVGLRIGDAVDGEEHMELGPRGFSVLHLQVIAAVVDGKGHVRESRSDIRRRLPVLRIFRMVIVAVHGQAVAAEEVVGVAVAAPVLRADIVVADGLRQRIGVCDFDLMGIEAITL